MSPAWRRLLLPLVPLYFGVVQAKRWLYDEALLQQRQLGHPVISVGSLSAGGAGKTPVVLTLAELLAERGFEVRVLTRGYGRTGTSTMQVNPTGDAAQFGDEPLMLAQRVPSAKVFVGRDRYRAGRLAERCEPSETKAVYLLDDGFQHRKLARQIDVLLITRQDLEDMLLPAGNLREPIRSAWRADFIVLREEEAGMARALEAKLPFKLPPILTIRRTLRLPKMAQLPSLPLLFSGLARPNGFVAMLADLGLPPAATHLFPDHHRYGADDIERLVREAEQGKADGFVTTEKDAVKLTSAMMDRLQTIGPLVIASLDVELLDIASAIETILARLRQPIP